MYHNIKAKLQEDIHLIKTNIVSSLKRNDLIVLAGKYNYGHFYFFIIVDVVAWIYFIVPYRFSNLIFVFLTTQLVRNGF